MKIKPIFERLIIERIEEDEVTAGGIYIPEQAKEKPMRGIVIAVGEGKILDNGQLRPMKVKAADKVFFGKFAGTDFKMDGKTYTLLREDDVFGIIED